ncbi:hypothetical protein F4604DRAFT_1574105 [Suillus subluteus]|nr:hypothetical protein F4604DRAFT_1574105 [Suillus subluteus]
MLNIRGVGGSFLLTGKVALILDRLMNLCVSFLRGLHLLGPSEDFFSKKPWRDMPWLIVAWIMSVCDSINLNSTPKPSHVEWGTYGHAQKMRASMTYAFGRLSGLGNLTWHESDIGGGLMVGNPSISIKVSSYMCSLRRRKVHVHGSSGNDLSRWGGGRVRRLLSAAYTVAFICMLHIKPFHLWPFSSSEAHLCPVRALAAWLKESKVTSGYLFRKIASGDQISEANSPMVCQLSDGLL